MEHDALIENNFDIPACCLIKQGAIRRFKARLSGTMAWPNVDPGSQLMHHVPEFEIARTGNPNE
jgi:hypothetical protein